MFLTIVINIDPGLFRVGPFVLSWHGLLSVLGILATVWLGKVLLQRDAPTVEGKVGDGVAWMVIAGIAGARLLFVWENYQQFVGHWGTVLALTEGGVSQWGGVYGAIVGAYVWCRRSAVSFWQFMDAAGPAALLGLAVGRMGDVINGEHHSSPTDLPWGIEYVNPGTLGQPGAVVHPEVGYEMVLSVVILAAWLPFHRRLKAYLPAGTLGFLYLGVYALGRFGLSFLRLDSLMLGLRQAQWASLLMVLAATVVLAGRMKTRDSAAGPRETTSGSPSPAGK